MAKKRFGKFVALATISGAIAAGISYFIKYKSFHDELEEDFHDFEGEDEEFDGELPHAFETAARTYVSLNEKKDEAVDTIKDAADATADAVKDTAKTVSDYVEDMADAAKEHVEDAAQDAADAVKGTVDKISTTIEEDTPAN